MNSQENALGKTVSELISEDTKILKDGTVKGTLHYVEKYTQFSSIEDEQSGNYFPLHLTGAAGKKMTIKKNGVASEDKNNINYDADIILRVPSKDTKFSIEVDGKETLSLNFGQANLEAK